MERTVTNAKVTEAELANDLPDVLNRVRDGERLAVERDGTVVAVLVPPEPKPQFTYGDFIALLNRLPWPDEDFGKDLAEIQASQQPAQIPGWPD